jgi:hypothetical protein
MTVLPKEFKGRGDAGGWDFHQIRRNKTWALYERKRGEETTYELVRVRRFASDKRVDGRVLHEKGSEYYPAASKWGIDGFSYMTRETAEAAFSNRIRR